MSNRSLARPESKLSPPPDYSATRRGNGLRAAARAPPQFHGRRHRSYERLEFRFLSVPGRHLPRMRLCFYGFLFYWSNFSAQSSSAMKDSRWGGCEQWEHCIVTSWFQCRWAWEHSTVPLHTCGMRQQLRVQDTRCRRAGFLRHTCGLGAAPPPTSGAVVSFFVFRDRFRCSFKSQHSRRAT